MSRGPLTYRFFSAGAGSYLVLEEYADSAAAILHQDRVASSASVTWFPESWE